MRSTRAWRPPGMIVHGAPSRVTRAERRVGSRFWRDSTVTPSPTSTTAMSSPTAISSTLAYPPPSTAPASPEAFPSATVTEPREGDGAEGGAVGEAGKPGCLGRVVGDRVERGAGDHRRDERSGRHGPAELLDHHDELLEPVARTAVLLGEVEPQPAQVDQVVPEVGDGLGRRLEQRPGGTASVSLLQELRGGVGEGLVVFGDGDRHGRKRRPRAPHPLNGPSGPGPNAPNAARLLKQGSRDDDLEGHGG